MAVKSGLIAYVTMAALIGLAIATSCSSAGQSDPEGSFARPKAATTPIYQELSIDEAKALESFSAYWVGEEFQGLPVTRITRAYRPGLAHPEDNVYVIYGSCTLPDGGSCAPPLSIRTEPYCYKQPDLIANEAKESDVFEIRGAAAQEISEGLRLWTGNVSIRIDGDPKYQSAAADALVAINGDGVTPSDDSLPILQPDCSGFELVPYPE